MSAITTEKICEPYPGLRPFETEDHAIFFGREKQTIAMLRQLSSCRFLAVVGSSGSGKSSLVKAGLIPAIRRGFLANSAKWLIVPTVRPGQDPYGNLAASLSAIMPGLAVPDGETVKENLQQNDRGLLNLLKGRTDESANILVVIDQFEELFAFRDPSRGAATAHVPQAEAAAFVSMLLRTCADTEGKVWVLLTMRSEFVGHCEAFLGLPEEVSRSQFLVPRLDRNQMIEAIQKPAEAQGASYSPFTFEPGLINRVINDSCDSLDQLPLAQHVLRRMWINATGESRNELTLQDYKVAGGFGNSINEHAQQILNALPKHKEIEGTVVRPLFMALCDQSEDGPLVRRFSTRKEVDAIVGPQHAEWVPEVIAAFSDVGSGFIREQNGNLEVRHEAILRQWGKITDWRKLEATAEETLDALSRDADEYFEEADSSILWLDYRLEKLQKWEAEVRPTEAWAKRHHVSNWDRCHAFMVLSTEEERKIQEDKAAAARTQKQYERAGLIGLGIVFLAILSGGIVAYIAYVRAEDAYAKAAAAETKLQVAQLQLESDSKQFKATFEGQQKTIAELEKRSLELVQERDAAQQKVVSLEMENGKRDVELARLNDVVASLQKPLVTSVSPPGPGAALHPKDVVITLNWAEPQQRESANALLPKLREAGFKSVELAPSPLQRPAKTIESPERATEVVAIASSTVSDSFKEDVERASLAVSFVDTQDQPAITVWLPSVSPVQKLTSRVVTGTLSPTTAAAEIAKLGQPAVAALVKELEGANEQSRRLLQQVTALSLSKMPQPVFINAEEAEAIVTLMAAEDSSTRKNTTDFLMDLWDGESVRHVFKEVKELLEDNLGATPSNPARKSEHAVFNAASLLGTWASNLNSSIQAPAGSGSKLMREAALAAAKDLRDRLKGNSQQWGSTLGLLNTLIEKVEPTTPFEIRLENKRVTPLPAPYAKHAVYVCNFNSGDKTVRIYLCPAAGQPTDYLSEDKFKEINGAAAVGPFELTGDTFTAIKYAGKNFAVTLKHIHASSVWKDFATFTFKPE